MPGSSLEGEALKKPQTLNSEALIPLQILQLNFFSLNPTNKVFAYI